jgi:hypothetical protein
VSQQTVGDKYYARSNRDQMGVVHLSTRDDEAADAGCRLEYMQEFNQAENDNL